MDYLEFSKKIKEKYPQYSDVDDKELAEKIIAKYPEYSDITFDVEPGKQEGDQKNQSSNQFYQKTLEKSQKFLLEKKWFE